MTFVTFGEIMLRLSPLEHGGKIWDANAFAVDFAGSESNVASSLSILGNKVKFITKVPQNHLGKSAIRSLNSFGIDTKSIIRGGVRLGTYFIETGSSIRPSEVMYDRAGSAISEIKNGEFNWHDILDGSSWVFISGITPALSNQCAKETILLASIAKEMGVKVCFDFNFRRALWSKREKARSVFTDILDHTDLLCCNQGALSDVYSVNFKGDTEAERTAIAMEFASREIATDILAFTVREHQSASRNILSAMLKVENKLFYSTAYSVDILDRFGTGDAFAAGLLHGLEKKWEYGKSIQFAAAAFALKHTIKGDHHTSGEKEIISIMEGKTSGHVIR
jgi:2-dehydro-3-deoxygluconokinase